MSSSHLTPPEPPDDDPRSEGDDLPAQPEQTSASGGVNPNATDPQEPAISAGEDSAFDIDAEFAKLAAELDDIPGFRNLQPMPGPATGGPLGPRDWEPGPDDPGEDEFIAPDPEVRLDGDPSRVLGWAVLLTGIVTVLVCIVLLRVIPGIVLTIGSVMILVGAAILLWRLPRNRDDEWDTGARV
ncbi:hypothetical protein GCM10010401_21330 [Rarobacter faecitabidus]|uniref:Uncharacterized protein n=1 Tax=Rarobacter faecitabidus TaxID=13243 RepID=A0A542ZVF2_RARFA|nr:hypothetical protein [Rarobacter faecitabidus]TQL64337.1 hypothetical protein FB461_0839 [Rarobacter faecitabidus]